MFATTKNLVVKNMMFPHRSIHKYNWTSPDEKTHMYVYTYLTFSYKIPTALSVDGLFSAKHSAVQKIWTDVFKQIEDT
jgi:hypothetical protein